MITGHIEGIVSLLKTSNIAMLDGLLGTGFINVDEICIALKRCIVEEVDRCDFVLMTALLDRFDVTDQEIINGMICSFSSWNDKKHVWNENMARTFTKLMAFGGKMDISEMVMLPYDAFVLYTKENDYAICDDFLFALSHQIVDPKVTILLYEKLEHNIESISQASFFAFAISMIRFGGHTDLILQEVCRRQLSDTVFAYLTREYSHQQWLHLFDEYGVECENIDVYLFFQRCNARYYRRADQTYLEDNDLVEIDIMFRTNPSANNIYQSIVGASLSITIEIALDLLAKMKDLMAIYVAKQ